MAKAAADAFSIVPDDPLAWLDTSRGGSRYSARAVLAPRVKVVPVIGAGISVGASIPSSADIAAEMRSWDKSGDPGVASAGDDPRAVADALASSGALTVDEVSQAVVAYLERAAGTPSNAIDLLVRVPSRLIVTFNYDLTLEHAAQSQSIEFESLVLGQDQDRVLQVAGTRDERERLAIVHIHGSVEQPLSIVLDSLSYSDLANSHVFERFFERLLANFVLVFAGTKLDEPLVNAILLRNRTGGAPNLFVGDADACAQLEKPPAAVSEASHLLVVRGYASHEQLIPLLELIVEPVPAETVPSEPRVRQYVPVREGLTYVEPQLLPAHESGDDFYAAFMVAAGEAQALTEDDLRARGARSVIIGAPGSGKTTLMRRIGLGHGEYVRPVLVRLADAPHIGDPARLLEQWAEIGEGLRGEEEVSREALTERTFHFFLDGLDEVPRAHQEAMTDKVVQVARSHPEHIFTIASRDVPALDRFERPEWQHISLVLDSDWQAEYLARLDLTWETLVSQLPPLEDVRGLLELPFFLNEVVRLYQLGQLREAGDLGGVLSLLIEAALVEARFPADAGDVRRWLRLVALALLLSERQTVTVDELASIPMPEGLAGAGTAEEVAELLVEARIFAPSRSGRYGFVHRLFGEALAAEALLEYAPADHGLIDVAAPRAPGDLSGTRQEWSVPLAFAAARSRDWREALRERDALAAARAVPNDAPVEERRDAAQQIWDAYSNWRIWIWEWGRPSLVEDADSLARLLRTEGLEELRQAILEAAFNHETPREVRGNAFRVLSLLRETAVAPALKQVLEDSTQDSVLRRVAARAAAVLGLQPLFHIIAHRAIHPADDAEAQDMTIYALDLSNERELLPLALRLVGSPSGHPYIVLSKLRQQLSPSEELEFLRAWSASGQDPLTSDRERLEQLIPDLPPSHEAIEAAGYIAAAWHLRDDSIRDYVRQRPADAVRGLIAASAEGAIYDYELVPFLGWFTEEELREGGTSEELLQWKERRAV